MNQKELLFKIRDLNVAVVKSIMEEKGTSDPFDVIGKKPKISPTQFRIVQYLTDNSDKVIAQKDIEKYLGISRASVSGVLDTMEKHGVIKREISAVDPRSKTVTLQEFALEKMKEAKSHYKKVYNQISANISPEDLNTFIRIAEKMTENLSKQDEEKTDSGKRVTKPKGVKNV